MIPDRRPVVPPPFAPLRQANPPSAQRKALPGDPAASRRLQPPAHPNRPAVVQRASVAEESKGENIPATLAGKAEAIWNLLSASARGSASTTIAVIECTDGKLYCTSNDVDSNGIGEAAQAQATKMGISGKIMLAGAGFHAEMWATIELPGKIKKIGASRACCKNCSAVLRLSGITMEAASETTYKSWINPLTVGVDCQPKADFAAYQRKSIPDFRSYAKDNWFTSTAGAFTKTPQGKD